MYACPRNLECYLHPVAKIPKSKMKIFTIFHINSDSICKAKYKVKYIPTHDKLLQLFSIPSERKNNNNKKIKKSPLFFSPSVCYIN